MPETEIIEPEVKETPKSIVEKAAASLNPDGTVKTEEKKVEPEKKDPPPDEKKAAKALDQLSEEDREIAASLLLSLKDPEQSPAIIKWFADQGGYTKTEAKEIVKDLTDGTKKEQQEAKDEIVEAFAEQFGEDFAKKIAPLLKNAIDSRVASLVEEKTKGITQTFETRELAEATTKAESVLDSIGDKFYEKDGIPAEVRGEMSRLMDKYPASKGQTVEDYLSDIHALAAAQKGGSLKPVDKTRNEKIDKNRNDIPGRLNNGRSPSPSKESVDKPLAKDLKEAVARAEEQLRETFK
jgi:hypothetical protein